jgi:hypothetical protein
MFVIVAVKGQLELIEAEAGSFLSISLCFLQLANQSVIHIFISFQE